MVMSGQQVNMLARMDILSGPENTAQKHILPMKQ
jgi:hypothetical protein